MKKYLPFLIISLSIPLWAIQLKNPNPKTPADVWQNDKDLQDAINRVTKDELSFNFYNVREHGVKADGTNESSVVQAILNATALAGGGVVFFPKGTYKFSVNYDSSVDTIKIMGEGMGTIFEPIDATHFVFTSTRGFTANDHQFSDFKILGSGASVGRGIYLNNGAFNNFENVVFDNLEYCIYINSTEWDHFENCHFKNYIYGVVATTLASDILGNSYTVGQSPNFQYFSQCHFWQGSGATTGIGFYFDNKNDPVGDRNASNFFIHCDFINNALAIGSGYAGSYKYQALSLIDSFFNNGLLTGTQTFNGYTLNNGDLSISSGAVAISNCHFEDTLSFLNNCRVTGTSGQILGQAGSSINISTAATVRIDNLIGDQNGGLFLDQIEGKNFMNISASRPVGMRLPTARSSFVYVATGNANVDTVSCAFGGLPPSFAGSPSIVFFNGDGFYHDKCVRVSGVSGDAVKWRSNLVTNRYYVTTFSMRTDISTTVTTANSIETFTGNGTLHLSKDWRTFGAITQSAFTGTAILYFQLNGPTTFYVSSMQTMEFNDQDAALNYLNSDTLSIPTSEVFGLTLATIRASTSAYVGEELTCSNCTSTTECVSTNTTTAGRYAAAGQAPTVPCQ